MFKHNKYTKWYDSIIQKSQSENRTQLSLDDPSFVYYEKHHIIPECMGGTETTLLTAREHFICHLLLTKMTDDRRMKYAVKAMTMDSKRRKLKITSHTYSYIKRIHAESVSERLRDIPKTIEHKKKMSDTHKAMWQNEEWIQKQKIAKQKTSQKIKELWSDPAWREKMLEARKK